MTIQDGMKQQENVMTNKNKNLMILKFYFYTLILLTMWNSSNNDRNSQITHRAVRHLLNQKAVKTEHIVLATHDNVSITLSDFITTFRNFSQSLADTTTQAHSEQDMIDPINLATTVTKLIDRKYPRASVMDKLNVLVRCGSSVKIERGADFWLGHLIDFCIGMSLLTRMGGDVTKNEGFPAIQQMWTRLVDNLPGPE